MTAGRPPIGDRAMTNAEHQRRWYDKHRRKQPSAPPTPPRPAFKPKRKEKEGGRLCVDKHDRILVDPPARGERIYVDERGREIAEPPATAGRTYIDDSGRIVEELPRTMTDEELARTQSVRPAAKPKETLRKLSLEAEAKTTPNHAADAILLC